MSLHRCYAVKNAVQGVMSTNLRAQRSDIQRQVAYWQGQVEGLWSCLRPGLPKPGIPPKKRRCDRSQQQGLLKSAPRTTVIDGGLLFFSARFYPANTGDTLFTHALKAAVERRAASETTPPLKRRNDEAPIVYRGILNCSMDYSALDL